MKISTNNGDLNIPADFGFSVKATHPFFSKEGVASFPLRLPLDKTNRRLLGHPELPSKGTRPDRNIPIIVTYGVISMKGRLLIDSIEENEINACIALEESELYASIKDLNIQDVVRGEVIIASQPDGVFSPTGLYRKGLKYENLVFLPVITDIDPVTGQWSGLNIPDVDDNYLNDTPGKITINGEEINAPAGYGLSPFIMLAPAVRMIFEKCGYRILHNCLEDDGAFSRLVLLNSVADNLCEDYSDGGRFWKVQISDLLPDITVGELIEWLRNKFGVLVVRQENGIDIVQFDKIMKLPVVFDITDKVTAQESVTYPEPKGLRIEMAEGEGPRVPAAEDLPALLKKYPNIQTAARPSLISASDVGLFYIKGAGTFYHVDDSVVKFVGSDAYPHSRHVAEDEEVISSEDVYVPSVTGWHKYNIPYVGARQHNYLQEKSTDGHRDIMVCYLIRWRTLHEIRPHAFAEEDRLSGCSHPFTPVGSPAEFLGGDELPSLTPEGLHLFFSDYEKILANGAPTFKVTAKLSINDIVSTDWKRPIFYNGTKVIVTEMDYTIGTGWTVIATLTLQLIPSYVDAVDIPELSFNSVYRWQARNNGPHLFGYIVVETDGIADYTPADTPSIRPSILGERVMIRKRWVKLKSTNVDNPITRVYHYNDWFETVI